MRIGHLVVIEVRLSHHEPLFSGLDLMREGCIAQDVHA